MFVNIKTADQLSQEKLESIKQAKLEEINAARDEALVGGFEFSGSVFDSDPKSLQRINGAVTLAMLDSTFSTHWITQNNETVLLDAQALIGLGQAAAAHESTQIFKARQLKDQVLAATTAAEVDAVVWFG